MMREGYHHLFEIFLQRRDPLRRPNQRNDGPQAVVERRPTPQELPRRPDFEPCRTPSIPPRH